MYDQKFTTVGKQLACRRCITGIRKCTCVHVHLYVKVCSNVRFNLCFDLHTDSSSFCDCHWHVGLHASVNPLSTDGHYSGHLAKLRFLQNWQLNSCTFTTLILKNLCHWFVFISDFRTYQVFSGPWISQCIVFNWKALMLISPRFSSAELGSQGIMG